MRQTLVAIVLSAVCLLPAAGWSAIPPGYVFSYSLGPGHSNPMPLDGATVSGPIYVFIVPPTPGSPGYEGSAVASVTFAVGAWSHVEHEAPYDMAGDDVPLDFYATFGPGTRAVTATVLYADSVTVVLSASVTVSSPPGVPHTTQGIYYLTGTAYHSSGIRELVFQVDEQPTLGSFWAGWNADFGVKLPSAPGATINWGVNIPLVLGANTVRIITASRDGNDNGWIAKPYQIVRDPPSSGIPAAPGQPSVTFTVR